MSEPKTDRELVLEAEIEHYRDAYGIAVNLRDSAREASNRNLEEKRQAEAEVKKLRTALAFASSCIKSGEPWTATCEDIIGGALDG